MFVSPLPRDSDIPSVASTGQTGFVPNAPQSPHRGAEQTRGLKKYPGEKFGGKSTLGGNTRSQVRRGGSVSSVQRLGSADQENSDVNLTASLETFIAGIQGQQAKDHSVAVTSHNPQGGNRIGLGEVLTDGTINQQRSIGGEARERRAGSTMEDYGRSSYAQSALGTAFPETYANNYVVAGGGEPSAMPATSSYQVVLSDGTSYPSAVFPAAIHYAEPATTVSPVAGATTNYYKSYYRRQFPASPIVADSAMVGDDGAPAVSLPHEKYRTREAARIPSEHQKISNDEPSDRPTITSLTEPMLLVDGVMGLPLRGQAPSDRGASLLSNPLAHSRDSRLLMAKKKMLPRPMQLIHVNRWDGKEVLTVDEGARRWLSELSTRSVAVISICGELQTGKSGLANLLLDDDVMSSTVGFAVGSSTATPTMHKGSRFVQRAESEGKTEGVWVSAVEAEGDKDNLVYLVLDFEGIGSRRKTVEHDQRLFTLALLVSHFLVFVTRGAVDSDTLFSLASASAWTQRLRMTHGGGIDRPDQKPPTPTHAGPSSSPSPKAKVDVASLTSKPDFNMSMVDEQQNPLTAGDYLEALLSLTLSEDTQNLSKLALALENSQIRMARQEVSDLFDDRDCVALPSPLGQYIPYQQQASSGQTQARALEAVSVSEFVPLYQRRLAQLRSRVFRDCKGRALDGTALTGISLTRILEKLVEGINAGEVPESVRLLGSIQHDECRRWKQVCEEAFTKELRDTFQAKLPVPTKELQDGAEQLQRKYSEHFKIHAIGDDEILRHYKTQLKEKLRRITERALEENERHAEWKCRQKAKLLSDKLGIDQKINGKLYMDLQALNDDLALLRQEQVSNIATIGLRTAALLHQKTMDAERKSDKAVKLEQELQNKDFEAEQLRRELEDEREQQTLQEERHRQETKELRRELAEQRETNQRLSALYHSRVMDEDDGYRFGVRRSKHSAVGLNDQPRCFGNKCTIM
ncbi:guanylate binding protein, putative [Eimeria praecox]|uniref:Guanylate binding protein, putative n=2 Tax=Eimeria TaxID=5800 RepID=U6H1K9_9EIME|nr:guanylate binding protein, putative [Eimeria praecox]